MDYFLSNNLNDCILVCIIFHLKGKFLIYLKSENYEYDWSLKNEERGIAETISIMKCLLRCAAIILTNSLRIHTWRRLKMKKVNSTKSEVRNQHFKGLVVL